MAVRLDYQPIRRVENSSSGSMDKTNQSDFVTTCVIDIRKLEEIVNVLPMFFIFF